MRGQGKVLSVFSAGSGEIIEIFYHPVDTLFFFNVSIQFLHIICTCIDSEKWQK